MKFMIMRKADPDTEAGVMPSEALLESMGRYNEQLVNAGVMVAGEGLQPSNKGARIRFNNGQPVVTDGPFAETKELLAGYTLIEVGSKQEALDWAKRWPPLDGDGNVELELRQVFTLEDFTPGPGVELHAKLGERIAKQPDGLAVHLSFNGNCREAFSYYADCLGGDIEFMMTHGEAPEDLGVSEDWKDKILHASLNLGNRILMGADAPAGYYEKPQGFAVQLSIDDPERAQRAFSQLSEGGRITMPFEETFWARRFGMLVDRFDVPWMINCDHPE